MRSSKVGAPSIEVKLIVNTVLEIVTGLTKVLSYLEQREIVHGQLDLQAILLFGGSKLLLKNFGYGTHIVKDPMPLPEFHRHRIINKFTPP